MFSKGGESVALFGSEVRSRTVPATTVSLKMIGGLRGIITVELELTGSRLQTRKEADCALSAWKLTNEVNRIRFKLKCRN
jgi:hypothetical protein